MTEDDLEEIQMLWEVWFQPRDNIPRLLAEVRRLRDEREAVPALVAEVRRLRAENADLREKLIDYEAAAWQGMPE